MRLSFELKRRATLTALAAISILEIAGPAHAWKPKTHLYFAEQALRDAIDNGKVTIYQTDYRTGRVVGVLGEFPVDPRILQAIRNSPKQFRAGVLGPDAYPDITTGQCLIHPHQANALDGQVANGTNSWLRHIWDLTYGPMNLYTGDGTRAFAVGYLTHASGDLFAHTFMNNFSGGEFMLQPDPRNALKHLVLEGYIGKRTPLTIDAFGSAAGMSPDAAAAAFPGSSFSGLLTAELKRRGLPMNISNIGKVGKELEAAIVTENDVSIDGLENFLAGELTYGRPGSVLYDKLLNVPERKKSLPYLFSTLRNKLQGELDYYNKLSAAAKIKYSATHPLRITFIQHWVKDIDKGLIQWPKTSHEMAKALVYNETLGGADLAKIRSILDDYVKNYLVYMGPVPDVAVDVLKLMGSIMDALVPDFIKDAIDEMVKDFQNWVVEKATGKTLDEWVEYVSNPNVHFDEILNAPGGDRPGRSAQAVTLAQMNQDYLKISDTGYSPGTTETFKIDQFPPAFNTLQMNKLLLLGKDGVNQLLDALAAKGARRPSLPADFENVMLGWHQSLDNDNQWQGLAAHDANPNAKLIFAQDGGDTYQRLFMKQVGEVDWVTAPAPAPEPGPTNPGPGAPGNTAPSPEAVAKLLAGLQGNWKTSRGTILAITEAETTDGSQKLRGAAVRKFASGATNQAEGFYLDAQTDTTAGGQWTGIPASSSPASLGRVTITLSADGDSFTGTVTTTDGATATYNGTRIKDQGDGSTTPPDDGTTAPGNPGGGTTTPGTGGQVPPKSGPGKPGDGKFYSLDGFDIRIDQVKMGRGDTLEVFVTYRNAGQAKAGVVASTAALTITDDDGVGFRDKGNLYRVSGDEPQPISGTIWVEPTETARVRYVFVLPDGVAALKKLTVQEHGTRKREFDLTAVPLTAP